ncbi:unnamed protein product [Choristocarpus tenellus]
MADSWEDENKPTGGSSGGLNPNASSFTFNPSASTWSPGGVTTPSNPTPGIQVAQAAAVQKVTSAMETLSVKETSPAGEEEQPAEEVDENDPLWKATLELANGDRSKALKMLEDPDALLANPDIAKMIADSAGNAGLDVLEGYAEGEGDLNPKGMKNEGGGGEEREVAVAEPGVVAETVVEEKESTEEDPREHLNIVFIGHVDAGKSTLSGNILYLTDFVDRRTIERYEREAKQRNRESWFLAFIMDTNEEERAKGKTVEVGRAHFETQQKRQVSVMVLP